MNNFNEQPPQAGGYSGISMFIASSENPSEVMNEIMIQINNMNGQVLLQEPFHVMWRVDMGYAIDTVLTAWLRTHGDSIQVHIDLVGGVQRSYLDLVLPMARSMYLNGAFAPHLPFNEEEWRLDVLSSMARRLQNRIDDVNEMIDANAG